MKLNLFIMVFAVFQVSANNVTAQKTRLDLKMKNASFASILDAIEKQSDVYFFYNKTQIDETRRIDANFENKTVEEILSELGSGLRITYEISGKNIIIKPLNTGFPSATQQTNTVSGKVTDSSGQPLPGVTVMVEGTTTGTITDALGAYSVKARQDDVLVFSFIGMQRQIITVAGQHTISVVMREDQLAVDEVIVIGYGTAKRQEFTGAVSSVKMEDSPIALAPNLNLLQSLKGNVSGLNIGATTSAGGQPSMLVRGQNSISGTNDPLIVLDGVIYLGALSDINPNDIASIDVLKDAVSAAAYGSRSANGVIAVTTKRGSSGKPVITFNTSGGIQVWQNRPEVMKGQQWFTSVNERNGYTEGTTSWLSAGELENYEAGLEIDWLDESTVTGILQDYQLSVSGTGQGINYYLSAAYKDNKGIVTGDTYEQISVMGKINTDITSWLKVGVDANFSRRDYSGFAADLATAQKMSPYGVMYRDDEGNLEKYPYTQSAYNPLWGVNDGTRDNMDIRRQYRLNSYASVDIPFIKGLNFRLNYLINYNDNHAGEFYYESYYVAEGRGIERYSASAMQGYLSSANGYLERNNTFSYVIDGILNYKNTFGKHGAEVTLVSTRDRQTYEYIHTTGTDFSDNGSTSLGMWGLPYATTQKVYTDETRKSNIGYLGRLSYSFDGKYFLTGSFRRDGSSVFGADNKWGNFSAAGLAWKVSDENFMKNINRMNFLKLKLSWGQNGNQGIDPYTTMATVSSGSSGGYRYEFSNDEGTVYYGLVQSSLGNSDLGWEKTSTWNTGFESAWFGNRLFADVDIYFSKTTDQIFTRNIPVMTGFKTITTSMGQVNNTGVEATVRGAVIQNRDWDWTTSVSFWKNWNKLVELYSEDSDGDGKEDNDISNSLFVGKSLGAIYGYKQNGIVQEEDTEYIEMTGVSAGTPKYVDITGEGSITSDDRTILGYDKENFRMSWSNNLSYKNFEFYMLITGIFGGNDHYLRTNTPAYLTTTDRFNDNMPHKEYWTAENRSNKYPKASFSGDSRFIGLQSRGFVRIQDISLSYSFNNPWVKAANIRSLRVFFSAQNVATFTNWEGGDPESGARYLENSWPVVSTYMIGLNISF